jgi:hypothetical protein
MTCRECFRALMVSGDEFGSQCKDPGKCINIEGKGEKTMKDSLKEVSYITKCGSGSRNMKRMRGIR